MNYDRFLEKKVVSSLFKGKVICIFGPRRSGKTTLVKEILMKYGAESYYLNCENLQERQYLVAHDPKKLKDYLPNKRLIVLDEAQTIEDIGTILKVFVDTYPEVQLIATGSSSFELANRTGEPLVGRSQTFFLYPLSFAEISAKQGMQEATKQLQTWLRFGMYPAVVNATSDEEKIAQLNNIATGYLYKDIFTFERLRKPRLIEDLLKLLALQMGSEVSLNELAQKLDTSRQTIERYLDLLEKAFVIRRLHTLARNLRNEIRGNFKVYFFDIGIRNTIVNAFGTLENRLDIGILFENFFIMERMKKQEQEQGYLPPSYFWRTHTQKEIDYLEEKDGMFTAFECKWSERKKSSPAKKLFIETYPGSTYTIVTPGNFFIHLV